MRRPERGSRATCAVLVSVAIAGVLTPAAPASAEPASAAAAWSISPSPNPPAPARGSWAGVTCPSSRSCLAVGQYQDHEFNNRSLVGRWTGSTWSIAPAPFPAGSASDADTNLSDIACASTNLCFAVGYTYDAGVYSTLIERWNGTAWSVVLAANPPGLAAGSLSGVTCRDGTTCFAVGFAYDGTGSSPLVVRWKGTSWSRVTSPNPAGGPGFFEDVSCSGTTCFAVGEFIRDTTHRAQTLVERWNGIVWSVVASPNPPGVNDSSLRSVSCPTRTRCVAVGTTQLDTDPTTQKTLIERWNGTSWSIIASPNVAGAEFIQLTGVSCSVPSDCTAVGSSVAHTNNGTLTSSSLIERWNGTAWSIIAGPNSGGTASSGLAGISCPASTLCIAVGSYTLDGRGLTLIDRWDGTSWSVVANGGVDSRLRRVACTSPTNCFAVGDAVNGSTLKTLIERWNGTSWAIASSPNLAVPTLRLSGVACATATMCMAVGQYVTGTTTKPFVERWNGGAWSLVASPDPGANSSLLAVECPTATTCFAVGQVAHHTLIERWNGTSWSIVTSPNRVGGDNVLSGIACPSTTNCFAVGTNRDGDFSSKTLVERWNGASWSIVASPSPGVEQNRLNDVTCTSATNCFAVGGVETIFDAENRTTLVERWNGTTWSIVHSPNAFEWDELSGIACASATSCTAVGFGGPTYRSGSTVAETWNGTTWSVVATRNRSEAYANQLLGVACPDTLCFAVGSSTTDIGESTLVERNS